MDFSTGILLPVLRASSAGWKQCAAHHSVVVPRQTQVLGTTVVPCLVCVDDGVTNAISMVSASVLLSSLSFLDVETDVAPTSTR